MESRYAIYTSPADVTGEPIGYVYAESPRDAAHKAGRIIVIGYDLRVVRV